MIRHVDTAVKEVSVFQGDLELAAGNASGHRIVVVHGEVEARLPAPSQGLGGVADSLLVHRGAIGEMHDRDAERADGPLEIELPGRRRAGAVAIRNVPELRFVRELGGDAIFAVRINIVADNLAKRLGRRGSLQQEREHRRSQSN